nr:hypothetical protein [uncultured Azospirillum sp.]
MDDHPTQRADRMPTDQDYPLELKVQFLQRPDAYFDRPGQVEAIETRLSWVFLTEGHAYKLKKPRRLPEVNLSTVALRHANCLTEIRLNRRLSPMVYHAALCLALRPDGGLSLCERPGPADRVVDWVVWMQRLPIDRRMDELIGSNSLQTSDVRNLGITLSRFYRFSRSVPMPADRYLGRFAQDVEKNQIAARTTLPEGMADRANKAAIWQRGFLKTQRGLLRKRAEGRRIIEAHGDLRPEHIFFTVPLQIIDCLEFDRALRLLDPVDELSYLGLECDRLGEGWIASHLLKIYEARSGDRADPHLVAFYRSVRACIRIRLAAHRLADATAAQRRRWLERIDQYLTCIEKH